MRVWGYSKGGAVRVGTASLLWAHNTTTTSDRHLLMGSTRTCAIVFLLQCMSGTGAGDRHLLSQSSLPSAVSLGSVHTGRLPGGQTDVVPITC